jgi:nitrate reductase NapD
MRALERNAAEAAAADLGDIHIAGALVHSRPLNLMQVIRAIDRLAGAQVYQSSAEGKIVVVIEAPSGRHVLDVIDAIRILPGVLNVSLVYQHAEPAASMQQELDA